MADPEPRPDEVPATPAPAPAPPPGAKREAMAAEQAHVSRVHDRVEDLRRRAAARSVAAAADRSGSTFQARFERDVMAHHHAARAARYTFGDLEALVFGRIDRVDGDSLHVGRVSVVDEHEDVLLVDWRAPAAAPFYQATAAEPAGVARRRTLTCDGRTLRDLDDEVLDTQAADRMGLEAVTGQGALLAALERTRTGHMRDIVATIQAEQDRIIRLPAAGTVVVTGGPGTGKTVVALHRVAFLLYTNRERFEGRGVLVVGPSGAFTEYISRVLPSLGEDRAVLRSVAGFAPRGVEVEGWDEPDVAALKGDLRMVELMQRLLAHALPVIPSQTRFSVAGTTATASRKQLQDQRRTMLQRLVASGASYHDRVEDADAAVRRVLWRAWRSARRAGGQAVPEQPEEVDFDELVAESPQVRALRRSFWPVLDPVGLLDGLRRGEHDLARVAGDLLEPWEVRLLARSWAAAGAATVDDVALLDELRALIGPPPERARPAATDQDGIRLTLERDEVVAERPDLEDLDYADFAHVVVDEAQDLSPMQWRMLARRGSYASWTVVGDLAQRSRVAEPRSWDDIARLIGRRQVTITGLHVNYRTPAEIVAVAREVLQAAGHDPEEAPTSVRTTGEHPVLLRDHDVPAAATAAARDAARVREGTVAIVAPRALVGPIASAVEATARQYSDRIRVLDPRTVKGLEFDDVIVAAPDLIASESAVGLHQLYVAVTRATRSLTLVARPDVEVPGSDALTRRPDAA